MTSSLPFLNKKYTTRLINQRHTETNPFGTRSLYDILITNNHTHQSITIKDFTSSPLHDINQSTEYALSMVVFMSMEWHDDHRDDGDQAFENIYNQLTKIMPITDMEDLQSYFYDKKTQK